MAKTTADAIVSWFLAAQDLGEYLGIRFGRIPPGTREPEWNFLPHTDYDGIGGFAELLRRRGAKIDRLPQLRHPASSCWWCLARALPTYLGRRLPVQWGPLDRGPSPVGGAPGGAPKPPTAVGWHVFDEATTALIRRVCRMAGVTVNSFLLKHLTKAIRPSLADQSAVVPWMLPVNLRGKVDLGRDTAMHTTFVSARVKSYETAAEVHRHIYAALARGEHWANWRMYSLVNWLSRSTKRRLIKTGHCYPQWYLGGFSNLGDWDPDKTITQPDCLGDWLFTPLAFRGLAVAAGCVTFQRRLSLTIQVHGSLTTTSAVPQGWVQNWANEIGVELPSMVESSASTAGL